MWKYLAHKIILTYRTLEFSVNRASSVFPEKLGKSNKQSLHFRVSKGMPDSISIKTISNGTCQLNFNESGGNSHSGAEISGNGEKRGIKLGQTTTKNEFLGSMCIAPKEDSGHHPMINLKKLKKHVSYIHFKMAIFFSWRKYFLKETSCTSST